ncbi:MAG: FAD-binding protein [Verrucomicrobia bacterium]|jgi:4-cresol dehydrogenase (hydroxylating) flavoprotein subunit|nr:FAD-binding protein [Verrucomicrobiota bacterium]
MEPQLMSQLHIWAEVDDLEIVPPDQIEPTLSGTTRAVPCLLKPGTRDCLVQVVSIAKTNGIPLYPVSRGKNWGYGAHLPVRDGCVIVSLERLRTMGPCEPDSNKVYVEPGVSQKDLYTYLKNNYPEFTFNVTAGGSDTSIIGNCLERGIGYYRTRSNDLHGLEILTIDGTIIRQDSRLWSKSHPDGIGPNWEGLFFQSNFGIVLGGWFSIFPKQESGTFLSIQNSDLDVLIDDLKTLYRNKLLNEITHIGDPGRKEYVMKGLIATKFPELPDSKINEVINQVGSAGFQAVAAIHGRKAVTKAMIREMKKLISSSTRLDSFSPEKIAQIVTWGKRIPIPFIRNLGIFFDSLGELHALSEGNPTNIGLLSLKMPGDNPNFSKELAVYLNATLPPSKNATKELRALFDSEGYKYSITYIVNVERSVSAIITLHFETTEANKVRNALERLTKALIEKGFPPYRAGIDQMEHLEMPPLIRKFKDFFDPLNLIAPGRYS